MFRFSILTFINSYHRLIDSLLTNLRGIAMSEAYVNGVDRGDELTAILADFEFMEARMEEFNERWKDMRERMYLFRRRHTANTPKSIITTPKSAINVAPNEKNFITSRDTKRSAKVATTSKKIADNVNIESTLPLTPMLSLRKLQIIESSSSTSDDGSTRAAVFFQETPKVNFDTSGSVSDDGSTSDSCYGGAIAAISRVRRRTRIKIDHSPSPPETPSLIAAPQSCAQDPIESAAVKQGMQPEQQQKRQPQPQEEQPEHQQIQKG